jgi:hypothetical protein
MRYCSDRIIKELVLENTPLAVKTAVLALGYSKYTAMAPNKEHELLIFQSSFVADVPKPEPETGGAPDQLLRPRNRAEFVFRSPARL